MHKRVQKSETSGEDFFIIYVLLFYNISLSNLAMCFLVFFLYFYIALILFQI